jgi:hypothetical protein
VGEVDTDHQVIQIMLGREYDKKTPSLVANEMFSLHREIPHLEWFVDGANRLLLTNVNQNLKKE